MPDSASRSEVGGLRVSELFGCYREDLGHVPLTAWDAYRDLYGHVDHLHDKTEKANLISCLMRCVARDTCGERDGLEFREEYSGIHRFNVVIVERELLVRFKKLDRDLQPSNVPTEVQKKIDRGVTSLFDDQLRGLVTVGYVPNEARTRPKSVHAIKHRRGKDSTLVTEIGEEVTVEYQIDDLFAAEGINTAQESDRVPEKDREPKEPTLSVKPDTSREEKPAN